MYFLLLLIITIPFVSVVCAANYRLVNFTKFAPIIFFAILCAIFNKIQNENYLEIFRLKDEISLSFSINKVNVLQLFLVNFIWLIFSFYQERFFEISKNQNARQIRFFFATAISLIVLIIASHGLITLLLACNLLSIFYYLFIHKIFLKTQNSLTKIFTFLLLFEQVFLFGAIILTEFFTEHLNFSKIGIFDNLSNFQLFSLFFLYFGAILFTILIPTFLFYRKNCNFEPIANYVSLMLFFALPKLCILTKIIGEIFGFGAFSAIMTKIGFDGFSTIFLLNIAILSCFLLFSHDFKAIFFYLFLGQLVFAIFSIMSFSLFDEERFYKVLPNFILATTLAFLTFSNLILYLRRAENKDVSGLFYDMKITISLMIFAFANLIGLAPTNAIAEKIALLKIIIQNNLFIGGVIFAINFFCLLFFSCKLFFPMFAVLEKQKSKNDTELAAKIDSSASLMLTSLVVAVTMILLPLIEYFL